MGRVAKDGDADPPPVGVRSPVRRADKTTAEPRIEVESLNETLQTIFRVLVGMMVGRPTNAIHRAIAVRCEGAGGATIITTNYDVCIESALSDANYTYETGVWKQSPDSHTADRTARILKLHGSLSWQSCVSCDRYVTVGSAKIGEEFRSGRFAVESICRSCQAPSQLLIVPPISRKHLMHPILLEIRRAAEQALSDAHSIVVVGYSFTESDEHILRMFSRAIEGEPDKDILVLDTKEAPSRRLSAFLKTHARGFDDGHVIDILGDASGSLPVVIEAGAEALE